MSLIYCLRRLGTIAREQTDTWYLSNQRLETAFQVLLQEINAPIALDTRNGGGFRNQIGDFSNSIEIFYYKVHKKSPNWVFFATSQLSSTTV